MKNSSKTLHRLFPENLLMPVTASSIKDNYDSRPNEKQNGHYWRRFIASYLPIAKIIAGSQTHFISLFVFPHLLRFDELATVADWASQQAGGRIIVGGSLGTVLLVDVMENAAMHISFSFSIEEHGIADAKWANLSRQFIVTTTKGKVVHGYLHQNSWKLEQIEINDSKVSHFVAWEPKDSFIIVGRGNKLLQIFVSEKTKNEFKIIGELVEPTIKAILWSPIHIQISTIVILTENYLTFCEYDTKERAVSVMIKIKLKKLEVEYIGWGEDYTCVVGYGRENKNEQNKNGVCSFTQKMNGKWVKGSHD